MNKSDSNEEDLQRVIAVAREAGRDLMSYFRGAPERLRIDGWLRKLSLGPDELDLRL